MIELYISKHYLLSSSNFLYLGQSFSEPGKTVLFQFCGCMCVYVCGQVLTGTRQVCVSSMWISQVQVIKEARGIGSHGTGLETIVSHLMWVL